MADQTTVEVVPIGSLTPDAANVRKRDDRAKKSLAASLKQFGPARSIVLDGKGIVRAGNGTLEAAEAAGVTEILKIHPKPGQLVAVVRDDWSATEATGYAIADNRLAELAHFDEIALHEQLETLADEGFDLDSIGFTAAEIEELTAGDADAIDDGEWPEHGAPESHTITLRYRPEDVPVLMRFLGESDDAILVNGKAGAKVLERIREIAPR